MEVIAPLESEHFPYLPVRVGIGSVTHQVEALLDTGFDGDFALPVGLFPPAQAPDGFERWELLDGLAVYVPFVRGILTIGSFAPLPVALSALGDTPMVGRRVSDYFRIILDRGMRFIVEL